ncbi:hypothetical protein M9H77_11724 [Catharanthus roseus]|uniref:Uncharacterized protein n=1 Tax=Catharanthus roseus TaxID=4058 RepID=A0ACC0BFB3_CATRO|nr:hypothetical protein M9H77_11724 [Catharanthus roseus]
MKSRPRSLDVPLVDVPFQEDVGIVETSRIDVDVQDIGTLIHESGELESIEIHGRSSIMDEDENNENEEEVEWESAKEEEMVYGSKKRAHPEMSTPPAVASIPPGTSPASMASLVEMSTLLAVASTLPATLTSFLQLPYLSSTSTSTPSLASSTAGMSSRPAASSALSPAPSSQDVVDSRILILPIANRHLGRP